MAPFAAPPGAVSWRCYDDAGQKLGFFGEDDAEVYDWPVTQLSARVIGERWGGGTFTLRFYDGKGAPKGRKEIRIAGAPRRAGDAELVDDGPSRALTPLDPMERGMQLFGFINQAATVAADKSIAMQSQFLTKAQENLTQVILATTGAAKQAAARDAAEPPAWARQIIDRLDALEDELGDPEDDPPGAPMTGPTGPEYPSDFNGIGDLVYRMIVRNMPAIEKQIPDLLDMLKERIAAAQAEAAARAAG